MSSKLAHDFSPYFIVYKDGHVERLRGTAITPPGHDLQTGVQSKDILISTEPLISARLYIPKTNPLFSQKLPLLIYFHGGAFVIETAFCPSRHNHINSISAQANVMVISVDYRRAPEHPLPIAYEDSWASLKWVDSHFEGKGSEEWMNSFADLQRVFLVGDSAGGNIAHNMAKRIGEEKVMFRVKGMILEHPFFWGKEPIGTEVNRDVERATLDTLWVLICPSSSGSDDPLINPAEDSNLGRLGCERVLVFVAEKDMLKDRGWYYCELLKKSGWRGVVEVFEAKGEDHVFHLKTPKSESAFAMLNRISTFINQHNHV